MDSKCILVLGGARGGKSKFAQDLASKLSEKVLFVATGQASDDEMQERIENHKKSRPRTWRTLEAPTAVADKLRENLGDSDVVIIDCITMLVANLLGDSEEFEKREKDVVEEVNRLIECIDEFQATSIIVSNEVGLGIVPENKLARYYRDFLGKANQLLAQRADEVYLLVAGLPVEIKRLAYPGNFN